MIKTIIFDFGDVFINLDKQAIFRELSLLGPISTEEISEINLLYEVGKISTFECINLFQKILSNASKDEITHAWNSILLDFPKHRLDFIQKLALEKKYNLILLSNTNELHIDWIKKNVSFYEAFRSSFNYFYLSHEIQLRKPNTDIFEFVLEQHQIVPNQTIFIDDTKENTDTASKLGIHIWNNDPKTEDVSNLFTLKSNLF
ncbi:HAD family phosphatase [Aquimarina sp. AD10]|uniref:HAD family hydrolase n=1 Tax=Aquimarina sp. AD10 TaxID=1714849 RepID=UPI000E4C1527|nr:HAD family phosphatase [Aquimarina sp. AD10]AXT63486.1 HAD family phosphatase [Aquimarina sp. AD10]RKM99796.1 HAD family phosphatase [Aquimarina sp. AD10]